MTHFGLATRLVKVFWDRNQLDFKVLRLGALQQCQNFELPKQEK